MGRLPDRLDRIVGVISSVGTYAAAVMVFLMMFMIVYYIVARKLGMTIYIVEEYSGYALVFIVYIALAYTLRRRGHITVDTIVERLKPHVRRIVDVLTTTAALAALTVLTAESIRVVIFSMKVGLRSDFVSQTILWPVKLLIPIGFVMLALELALRFIVLAAKTMDEVRARKRRFIAARSGE